MFHRKKQQPQQRTAVGDLPITPDSILGPDVASKLTPVLGPERLDQLTQTFTDQILERWVNRTIEPILTEEEQEEVKRRWVAARLNTIKDVAGFQVLADIRKVAGQVVPSLMAQNSLPADLDAALRERVIHVINPLVREELREIVVRMSGEHADFWPRT